MFIENEYFKDAEISLDDYQFDCCKFVDCTMIYGGIGEPHMVSCELDNCHWKFVGAAANTANVMKKITEGFGDPGISIFLKTFPMVRDWLKPEYLSILDRVGPTEPTGKRSRLERLRLVRTDKEVK